MYYWTDDSLRSSKIEAAYLNGTGRTVLLHENYLNTCYTALGLHDGNIYIAESETTHSYGYFYPIELPVAEEIHELLVGYRPSLPFHPSSFPSLSLQFFPSPLSSILFHFPSASYLTGAPYPCPLNLAIGF